MCQKEFSQRSTLMYHSYFHTGKLHSTTICKIILPVLIFKVEKPYVCNECQKAFTQRSGSHYHSYIHTGELRRFHQQHCASLTKSLLISKARVRMCVKYVANHSPEKINYCGTREHTSTKK